MIRGSVPEILKWLVLHGDVPLRKLKTQWEYFGKKTTIPNVFVFYFSPIIDNIYKLSDDTYIQ